jgi:NDP-sugar pyrophosphorylase family protein
MKTLNIVIPMAGKGSRFADVGYAFPKPLIEVAGQTMIEVVIRNLKPTVPHRFIFICQREHYEKYDLNNIFKNAVGGDNFEIVQINGVTAGAACTVLCARQYINNEDDLLIANSDQYIEYETDSFIETARTGDTDGLIMTFESSHPKWSYARTDKDGKVIEVAEKKLISNKATTGIYYFRRGSDFVQGAEAMIKKDCRHNGEFYVCPVYNELILDGADIRISDINVSDMHGLGTPEDLDAFMEKLNDGKVSL